MRFRVVQIDAPKSAGEIRTTLLESRHRHTDWLEVWGLTHGSRTAGTGPASRRGTLRGRPYPAKAMASISTLTSFGRRATSTVERAGRWSPRCRPYTSFMAMKSSMSAR